MKRLALLIATALPLAAQSGPPCPLNSALSRFCAFIRFEGGRATLGDATLTPNAALARHASANAELSAGLKSALESLEKPYRFALDEKGKREDDRGLPSDSLTLELRTFTGTWAALIPKLAEWTGADDSRTSFDNVLSEGGLFTPLVVLHQTTPLLFQAFDPEQGLLEFEVADPIDLAAVTLTLPPSVPAKRRARLTAWLRGSVEGRLWWRDRIIAAVRDFYEPMGLDPFVRAEPRARLIEVTEARPVLRIAFLGGLPKRDGATDWSLVERALYSILDDRHFRRFLARRDVLRPRLEQAQSPAVDFKQDLEIEPPYLNQHKLQVHQLLLQGLGLTAALLGDDRGVVMALQQQKNEPPEAATAPAARREASERGRVEAHEPEGDTRQAVARRAPVAAGSGACEDPGPRVRDRRTYVGFGGQYRPGQGLRTFVIGQRERLDFPFRDNSISGRITRDGDNTFGLSANYFADYLLFDRLGRRLSVEFRGGSEIEASRFLTGTRQNERRNGILGRAEFEIFRDRNGMLARVAAEVHRETVKLFRDDVTSLSAPLTAIDVAPLFLWTLAESPYTTMIRLEPRVRIAPGLGSAEPSFARGGFAAEVHQVLPQRFALDFRSRVEAASGRTPVYELPSLGGENLRGFRRDDALGYRLWSVQPELWTPVPFVSAGENAGVRAFVRRNVRLAAFTDFGGVHGGATADPGLRFGPGAGLRVFYGPAVFRLDWAYGFGDAATGGSRGKVYFSVGINLPI